MMEREMNYAVIVPWMLTLLSLVAGAWQYGETSRQKGLEPFLKKQFELSILTTDTVATLAVETNPVEWEKARAQFWKLYWGSLAIVEDNQVEMEMVKIGKILPTDPNPAQKLPMKELQVHSYQLALKIRQMILRSWDVDLPQLNRRE